MANPQFTHKEGKLCSKGHAQGRSDGEESLDSQFGLLECGFNTQVPELSRGFGANDNLTPTQFPTTPNSKPGCQS